ncbi:hypothetical protein [Pelosinus propionicus]|uniref:Uncharacterized protein n=1 Tax=Pelosinus propionicus DSM 13327 TaxID=1123291 RepID=A0A1I4IQD6_9FIRM|nr:hypothetical protein [Pelosinus propionicus]SFL56514.1 hypothetical protein SAMN04490355_100933 [Pelosinus propionicus DSM 13327]
MQPINKISPIRKMDAAYLQISRQNQMIHIQKSSNDYKRNYDSANAQPQEDIVEISVQGLRALRQEEDLASVQSSTAPLSYISRLIANYEK